MTALIDGGGEDNVREEPIGLIKSGHVKQAVELCQSLGETVDLSGGAFTEVNFCGAHLAGAALIKTNLFGADLSRVNLSGAQLERVVLEFNGPGDRGSSVSGVLFSG